MPFEWAHPLRSWIGPRDELWHGFAGRAPGGFVERVEILPHRPACGGECPPIRVLRTGNRTMFVGVGWDQAGIHREALATNQVLFETAAYHCLEDMPERTTLTKAAMAFFEKVE